MIEEQFVDAWTTLEPTTDQRRRIDARVEAWLDANDTSIASEWLELFRIAPFSATGLVAVSAVAVAVATGVPLLWLARVFM